MNPQFPVYIVSKGRWDSRLTSRAFERMNVPYYIIVEEQEFDKYAAVIDKRKILILDKSYLRDFETFDTLGDTIPSKGPGPARNFALDHSVAIGAPWHWCIDDNIKGFFRLTNNRKLHFGDGTGFRCMEDFCLRYTNVAHAGPHYETFIDRKSVRPPIVINTRIYSCHLVRNDCGFRWRCRYNDDTDFSLRLLKAGWCTIQFQAFLQIKSATLTVKGGCTEELYAKGARNIDKSRMIVAAHPDVAFLVERFGRWHHYVDYSPFKKNKLILRPGVPTGVNEYGLHLVPRAKTARRERRSPDRSTSDNALTGAD